MIPKEKKTIKPSLAIHKNDGIRCLNDNVIL